MTTQNLTSKDRRDIYAEQFGRVISTFTPSMGDRYSGQQIAAAKGIASKRAMEIIDNLTKSEVQS